MSERSTTSLATRSPHPKVRYTNIENIASMYTHNFVANTKKLNNSIINLTVQNLLRLNI